MKVNYAIVFVSNMTRSVAFYRDVIGLPLRFESPGWTEFATDGATFALHLSKAPRTEDVDSQETPGRSRPGFGVANLDEFHNRMIAANVPRMEEPKNVFGARVAQYRNPDGSTFSVGEERHGR